MDVARGSAGTESRSRKRPAPLAASATAVALALSLAAVPASAAPGGIHPKADNPGESSGQGHGPDKDPLVITKESDLRFGRVVILGNSGSVTVPAEGLPIYSNLVSIDRTAGPARFEIRGPKNQSIELLLTFPLSGTYGMNGNARLDGLSVTADYTTGFRQNGSLVRLKLDSGGTNAITVGGKLTFDSSNSSGKTYILIPISVGLSK